MEKMEELLCQLLWGQLQSLGIFTDDVVSPQEIMESDRIAKNYHRWLGESLAVLSRYGYLRNEGTELHHMNMPANLDQIWQQWEKYKQQWLEETDLQAQIRLVETTMKSLPDILTGKLPATNVIFPGSSMSLVEGVYKQNRVADYFNEILADVLLAYVNERIKKEPEVQLRILEIGAGTGGTSATMFRRLRPFQDHIAEYAYTDISQAFLIHADQAYSTEAPYLNCQIFNVELPTEGQSIHADHYDIAIATNVLHATRNIRNTVRNVKAALHKNGLLLINEMSRSSLFTHLTFGLLEGWWRYDDASLRMPGCPGLAPETWEMVLESEGLQSIYFPVAEHHHLGQQIIVAESDGLVRQTVQMSSIEMSSLEEEERTSLRDTRNGRGAEANMVPPTSSYEDDLEESIKKYVREILIDKLSQSLKVEKERIDADESFADYGVDSITGVQLVEIINEALEVGLDTTSLFDYSTVNQLSNHIVAISRDELVSRLGIKIDLKEQAWNEHEAGEKALLEGHVRDTIIDQLSQSLKVDPLMINPNEPFADYGVDSITGVRLVEMINQSLKVELDTTSLFDYSTIHLLTAHLMEHYGEKLAASMKRKADCIITADVLFAPREGLEHVNHDRFVRTANSSPLTVSEENLSGLFYGNGMEKEPIAIIGVSGRFSGSENLDELWEHLAGGHDLVEEVKRWDLSIYAAEGNNAQCRYGSFITDIDRFDPRFFNISGLEAAYMDPQQRLFLEESWRALEDAGYAGDDIDGRQCGVYVGCSGGDYRELFGKNQPPQAFWGNAGSIIPARIAYYLNLQGPAIAVDTACSSSLVAIHLACQGLWAKETEMAIAGGVFIQSTPGFYVASGGAGMLSPTGKCHSFDERADGFVPGEGVGVVVLKRLKEAIEDGDHIHGVIRGSGINQDGTTNGITAPSALSQERLERKVYDTFGINPENIGMVEAHGTGTKLGDPIEYGALTRAFRTYTSKEEYCAIGSIKTNIGHTATAAGVAGLIKILLSFRHRQIPPSLHFDSGNKHITFEGSPFFVNTRLHDWANPSGVMRCAAVSSFGFSGTNAHMVVEEAPRIERQHPEQPGWLIVLSARTAEQLKERAEQLVRFALKNPDTDCGNISYTFMIGRKHFGHRLALIVKDLNEMVKGLELWLAGRETPNVYVGNSDAGDWKEKQALKRFGEECVERCRHTEQPERYHGLLSTIADLYTQGYALNYKSLFTDRGYSRLSLPTYPFAKEHYWVKEETYSQGSSPHDTAEVSLPTVHLRPPVHRSTSDYLKQRDTSKSCNMNTSKSFGERGLLLFKEKWVEAPLVVNEEAMAQKLICFVSYQDYCAVTNQLSRALPYEAELIFVVEEEQEGQITSSSNVYFAHRSNRNSIEQALQAIGENHGGADGLLYLWALENSEEQKDYIDIIYLFQSLAATSIKVNRCLLAAFVPDAYAESWVGFERSMRHLLPDVGISVILQDDRNPGIQGWLRILCSETQAPETQSVLYRKGIRHIIQINETILHDRERIPAMQQGKTYLITGGMGEIGTALAAYGVQRGPLNLILTGRSPMDRSKTKAIQSLEKTGSRVQYIQADICDLARMKEGLKQVKQRFGPIHGVIHAAGNVGKQTLLDKDINEFQTVVHAKIKGVQHLDELLASEDELQWVCYFSSSSAILGDFGSCDYAVGNRFMSAYAEYRNERVATGKCKGRTYVIHWPVWKDGGMKIGDSEGSRLYLQSSGQRFLENDEAFELLDCLLAQEDTHHLVMAGVLERLRNLVGLGEKRDLKPIEITSESHEAGKKTGGKGLRIEQRIVWDLQEIISSLLQIPRSSIGMTENLADFGFDSISLSEFSKKLGEHFAIDISPSLFFGHSTPQMLLQYLMKEHMDTIKAVYSVEESVSSDPLPNDHFHSAADHSLKAGVLRKRAKQKVPESAAETALEPIAIIGMSGRFPGSRNVDELWKILNGGISAVHDNPEDRDFLFKSDRDGWRCGWVPGVSEFDPLFFEISPKEAEMMDPRQRLLLQETYKALEDAGYGPRQLRSNKIGVFVGAEDGDYQLISKGQVTSNHNAILAARLSYFLNLNGPVLTINTACSSGLVAAHQACASLRNEECDTAIAAGVNLMLTREYYEGMKQAGMLSPDGTCFAFDKRANGMVPGEAVAVVVFKKLSKAEADGDPIYAVIAGSGINYDGRTNGITAPSSIAQTNLLRSIYKRYRIDPNDIEYIVTHGTGTKLGDPVEVNALNDAFKGSYARPSQCALTSVKTSLGHTLAASGLVSLICLVQAMRYESIPPSLHCEQLNEYIHWQDSPFYVNTSSKSWPVREGIRRTGAISAFGMSGTNAHMVVHSYSQQQNTPEWVPYHLLLLSAKTEEALREKIKELAAVLENDKPGQMNMSAIAYTLQDGRQHFTFRYAIVIRDREEAIEALRQIEAGESWPLQTWGKVKRDFMGQKAIQKFGQSLINQSRSSIHEPEHYLDTLSSLAELYCQGYEFDWSKLFGESSPQLMRLPTYPFARDHYWAEEQKAAVTIHPMQMDEVAEREERFLVKQWVEAGHDASSREICGMTAILTTDATLPLAQALQAELPKSVILKVSDLKNHLHSADHTWDGYDGCVDLIDCQPDSGLWTEGMDWLQRLIEENQHKGIALVGVTRGLESIKGEKMILNGACRAALYRMLQNEYRHLRSMHLDVDPFAEDHSVVQQIAAEYRSNMSSPEITYRDGTRYKACLNKWEKVEQPSSLPYFPQDEVLWITGGTRGLGMLCAQHAVEAYGVKKLVLTGREQLPSRDLWQEYAGQTSPIAKKIRDILELENKGAEVRILSLPLEDETAVKNALHEVHETMGPVGGVFHCAGTGDIETPAFIRKSLSSMKAVGSPKIEGLQTLYRCFKEEPLQWFVLFSSVSAAVPSLAAGQSDYAMANAYMDYFAMAHSGSCPMVSIQWPSWKESGMGEARSKAYTQTGFLSHTDEEGLRLLDTVLRHLSVPVVMPGIVQPQLWQSDRLLERAPKENVRNKEKPLGFTLVEQGEQAFLENRVLNWLRKLFAAELKLAPDKMDAETPFQDYGADSIILAQLLKEINKSISGELDPSLLYEYPSLSLFSSWMTSVYADDLQALLGGDKLEPKVKEAGPGKNSSVLGESSDTTRPVKKGTDIAVVGMSCRFPGAASLDDYWSLLSKGRSQISKVPADRWGYENSFYAALLEDIEHYHHDFFLIPEEDARAMDPQALLLLEESLRALNHAGYTVKETKGRTIGVYVGARSQYFPSEEILQQTRNPIVAVGQNYLASNISHFFDFRGPSVVLDTACSSALVGMHMAVHALANGELEAALVGGVSLLTSDTAHQLFRQRRLLNEEGVFHVFDERAGGIVIGEGAGMVMLKTVERALADGDRIHAVIKGTAINNDGRTAGPATPNLQAQKEVMHSALEKSGKKPEEITYVEANGSGSQVTDLLELKAIQAVYRESSDVSCVLGSIKPNVGHPLSAEGIASFIKVVLMLEKGIMVPFLSGEQPINHFDWRSSPLEFCRNKKTWTGETRSAAINCFGDGGTNANVILESWQDSPSRQLSTKPSIPVEWEDGECYLMDKKEQKLGSLWKMAERQAPNQGLAKEKSFWQKA